jgi:hypothetical protein
MPVIIENKLITLNSAYGTQINGTYKSDILFNFKGILVEDDDIVSSNICIMNAQIPVSFYTINDTNNVFTVQIGVVNYLISLVKGNYNFNTLASMVSTAFFTSTGLTVTLTINKATGIITFSCPSALYYTFDKSYKIFGFLPNVNYNGATITAPYPCNLLGAKKLNIRSQRLQISSFNSITNNLGITISTIPVDVPAFSMISYINQTDLNKTNLQIKTIDQIDISIVNEDNELIDFNNIDWNITLVLENVRLIPDKPLPFKTLLQNQKVEKKALEEPIQDIKDLELLGAN